MKTPVLLVGLLLAPSLRAALPLNGSGTIAENFDSLTSLPGTEWTDNVTLPHWYFQRSNANAPQPIPLLINDNDPAGIFAAGVYSLGEADGIERSLGSAPTGVIGETAHVLIVRNTNAVPVQITGVGYTVEKWKENTTAGIGERLEFSYQTSPDEFFLASLPLTGWTDVNNLDTAVPHSGASGAVNNPPVTFPVNQAPETPILIEAGDYAAFRWLNPNEAGSDAYLGIDDLTVSFATVNAAITAVPTEISRDTKGTTAPGDDTFSFILPVVGIGGVSPAGWQLATALPAGWTGATSGNYGDAPQFGNIPVTAPSVSLTLRDAATPTITRLVTVPTPPVPATLTPTSGPLEVRFSVPPTGSTFFSRGYTDGLTDLGWTSNAPINAFNGVSTRPTGGDPNQYFRIRNFKLNRFQTEPVNVENVEGFDVSIQLAAYTTSATGYEDGPPAPAPVTFAGSDRVQVLVESSVDGVIWAGVAPSLVSSTQTGVLQFADFRIGDPGTGYTADDVTPSTLPAVIPFPATRTVRFSRGNATMIRLAVLGGTDTDTENTLFDNIKIAAIPPVITATLSDVIRDNGGDDNPLNDTFTFSLAIKNDDAGRPQGWISDAEGISGSYSTVPVPFPTYAVADGPPVITFTDVANPAIKLTYTVVLPPGILTTSPPAGIRSEGPTSSPADDTWTFSTIVTSVNGGTGYFNSRNALSQNYGSAVSFGPFPVSAGPQSITFTDRSDPSWTVTTAFPPPIRPVLATVSTGGPAGVVYSTVSPPITGWTEGAGQGILIMANGGGTVPHVLRSEPVNLSGAEGTVIFKANFTATENGAGTNFETQDTFKIELDLTRPSGTTRINLVTSAQDPGNGTSSANPNGAPNGVINGYTGTAFPDLGITTIQDYDANRERDEFNLPVDGQSAASADSFSSEFQFSALIPDDVTAARIIVSGLNNSPTESFTVSGMSFGLENDLDTDGDGATNADEAIAGTDPADPADVLRLTAFQPVAASNPVTFTTSFPSKAGRFYRLYRSPDLTSWTAEGPTLAGNGGSLNPVTQPLTGTDRVFYRLMVNTTDNFPATTP